MIICPHWASQVVQWWRICQPVQETQKIRVPNPWVGKIPEGGCGNPLWYSCLENSLNRGAWWAAVHGVAESVTWLSAQACTCPHWWISCSCTICLLSLCVSSYNISSSYVKELYPWCIIIIYIFHFVAYHLLSLYFEK